jgi:hypothetical protein
MRCVPKKNEYIDARNGIKVDVVKLAVVRCARSIVEFGVSTNRTPLGVVVESAGMKPKQWLTAQSTSLELAKSRNDGYFSRSAGVQTSWK